MSKCEPCGNCFELSTLAGKRGINSAILLPLSYFPPSSTSLPGASLTGASLPGASLPGASLPGASLPGASLPGASLPGASLPGASLPGASLPGASLPGAYTYLFHQPAKPDSLFSN